MKVFLYDQKHEDVYAEWEFPPENEDLISNFIEWLDKASLTNRYAQLVIASSYEIVHDDEDDDFGHVEFYE